MVLSWQEYAWFLYTYQQTYRLEPKIFKLLTENEKQPDSFAWASLYRSARPIPILSRFEHTHPNTGQVWGDPPPHWAGLGRPTPTLDRFGQTHPHTGQVWADPPPHWAGSAPSTLGWAKNACFLIKFRILQTLVENLLIHRKKGIMPKFLFLDRVHLD